MKGTPSDTDRLADPVAAKFLLVTQHHLTTQQNSQQDLLLSHCTVQDLTGWTSKPVSNIGMCVCVCVEYLQDFKLMEARQSLWVDECKVITSQTSTEREREILHIS